MRRVSRFGVAVWRGASPASRLPRRALGARTLDPWTMTPSETGRAPCSSSRAARNGQGPARRWTMTSVLRLRSDPSGRLLRCNPRRHAGFLGPARDRAPNAGPRAGGVRSYGRIANQGNRSPATVAFSSRRLGDDRNRRTQAAAGTDSGGAQRAPAPRNGRRFAAHLPQKPAGTPAYPPGRAELPGTIQIGDDQARSWIVAGRDTRGATPAFTASHVDQRQIGFSRTRT